MLRERKQDDACSMKLIFAGIIISNAMSWGNKFLPFSVS
jgi:hypothetical protein